VKIYTGIGSRETPQHILTIMTALTTALAKCNYILRSGGADGADSAFEQGATSKQIYLPWNGFNGKQVDGVSYLLMSETEESRSFVYDYHPRGLYLKAGAFKLMHRNTYQVLGADLNTPSDVLFCYTSDGLASGGTGQAMRIARDYNIPIINLYDSKQLDAWLTENEITLA
jgi:hypothetical protein